MKFILNKYLLMIIALSALFISSCADEIPTKYVPQPVVEGILIVDEPIDNIKVIMTQPVTVKYNYYKSMIKDAEVIIKEGNNEFLLKFNYDTLNPGYFLENTDYKVKPLTDYYLTIKLNDGTLLKGYTRTPDRFSWSRKVKDTLQYPLDTLKLGDRDSISWIGPAGYYVITVKCLDTLDYGKYQNPASNEKNRRIYRPYLNEWTYREQTAIGLIPNTKSTVVWSAFKWFGYHEVSLYNPDWNYLKWLLQNIGQNQANPLLSSIEGGLGVFGSASTIKARTFLKKNQP